MNRRILRNILSLTLCVSLIAGGIDLPLMSRVSADTVVTVSSWSDLKNAITNGDTDIKLGDDITNLNDDAPFTVNAPGQTITIDLDSHTINRFASSVPEDDGYVFDLQGGTLKITDGSSPKEGGIRGGNNSENGGAIIVRNGASFIHAGGTIHDNYSSGNGGAIYCAAGGSVVLAGGSVSHNDSYGHGGGIFFANGSSLSVADGVSSVTGNRSGDITENVYVGADQKITVTGTLINGSNIGVTTAAVPSIGKPVVIADDLSSDCSSCFRSDSGLNIAWNSGSVEVRNDLALSWSDIQFALDEGGVAEHTSSGTEYIVRLGQDITADGSDGALVFSFSYHDVVLDLNGHTLSRGLNSPVDNGNVMTIHSGHLIIRDSSGGNPGRITGGCNTGSGGGIVIDPNGTLTLERGAISGNRASIGGGVYIELSGSFIQQGGIVTGNTASSGGGVLVSADSASYTIGSGAVVAENTLSSNTPSNVLLPSGAIIRIPSTGFTGASIGVESSGDGVVITDGFCNYPDLDPLGIFTADIGCLHRDSVTGEVIYDAHHSGSHTYTWEWNGSTEAVVTSHCAVCGGIVSILHAEISDPVYDTDISKFVFTATATVDDHTLTDTKTYNVNEALVKPQVEPSIDADGRYIPGTFSHYELTIDDMTYNFTVDGDHPGTYVNDLSLSYFTFAGNCITGYSRPDGTVPEQITLPRLFSGDTVLNCLGNDTAFFGTSPVTGSVEISDLGNITGVYAGAFDGVGGLTLILKTTDRIDIYGCFDGNCDVTIMCNHTSGLAEGIHEDQHFTVVYLDHEYSVTGTTWEPDYSSATVTLSCSKCEVTRTVTTEDISITANEDENHTFTITATAVDPVAGTFPIVLENVTSYKVTLIHKIDDAETPYYYYVPRSYSNGQYIESAQFRFSDVVDPATFTVPTYSAFDGWTNGSTTYSHNYTVTVTGDTAFTVVWKTVWAEVCAALNPEPGSGEQSGTAVTDVNIKLYGNMRPEDGDTYIYIPENVNATIDMNSFTIDRCLGGLENGIADGFVFKVEGTLTLKNGTVTGGNNTGSGGGVYVSGTLVAMEADITANKAQNGAGIYLAAGTEEAPGGLGIMYGGSITFNTAENCGGGVFVSNYSYFVSTTILEDIASFKDSDKNPRRKLTGGNGPLTAVIENNVAGQEGGGIFIDPYGGSHFNGTPQVIDNSNGANEFDNIHPNVDGNAGPEQMSRMISVGSAPAAGGAAAGGMVLGISTKSAATYGAIIVGGTVVIMGSVAMYFLRDRLKTSTDDSQKNPCNHPNGHTPVYWHWTNERQSDGSYRIRCQVTATCNKCGHTIYLDSWRGEVNVTEHPVVDQTTFVSTYTATYTDSISHIQYSNEKKVDPYTIILKEEDGKASPITVKVPHDLDRPGSYTLDHTLFPSPDPIHQIPTEWVDNENNKYELGDTVTIDHDGLEYTLKWYKQCILKYNSGASDAQGFMPEVPLPKDSVYPLGPCIYTREGYVFGGWAIYRDNQQVGLVPDGSAITLSKDTTAKATWISIWSILDSRLSNEDLSSIEWDSNTNATSDDINLTLPAGRTTVLDLTDHTLNRSLTEYAANGNALSVLGTLTMNNGTITGGMNTGNGGGIVVGNGASLTMQNMTVTGNSCASGYHGGGIYVTAGGSVKVAGLVNVTGNTCVAAAENVYLASGTLLNITGALDANTRIGISMQTPGVFTSGLNGKGTPVNFVSDDPNMVIRINSNGEAYLAYKVEFYSGPSAEEPSLTDYAVPGSSYPLPANEYNPPEHSVFSHWAVQSGAESPYAADELQSITITGNTTVTAIWEEVPYFPEGHALQLNSQIGLQFFINFPDGKTIDDFTDCYVTFSGNKIDGTIHHPVKVSNKTNGYYAQIDLSSIQMADKITPTLHYTEGGVDKTVEGTPYSIKDYILAVQNNQGLLTSSEIEIVQRLADYGYYAQIFLSEFNHWEYGVAYAPMDIHYNDPYNHDEVKTVAASCAAVKQTSEQITALAYRMQFGSYIALGFALTPAAGVTIDSVIVDEIAKTPGRSGTDYTVVIPGILPSHLTEEHTVSCMGASITVSPMSYVYSMLNSANDTDNGKDLACALYYFAQACR
ncbi:MAG: S-layer family protein [Clostridiales bacterium]|nr:S-layer family protein [Clostridiales bacterium]